MKKIIEKDDAIEEVEMTECDFEPVAGGRKRRNGKEFDRFQSVIMTRDGHVQNARFSYVNFSIF